MSSIHDAKINNNIESLKTQQYYLIRNQYINSLSICFINFGAGLSHPKTKKNDITRCFTTCYVVISCGGKTRTCDLQVMSLASYQLLHSAILTIKFNLCCGGRTRTCDLQVMSLASYQLLHSAILTIKTYSDLLDKRPISELRLQRYDFLLKPPNILHII